MKINWTGSRNVQNAYNDNESSVNSRSTDLMHVTSWKFEHGLDVINALIDEMRFYVGCTPRSESIIKSIVVVVSVYNPNFDIEIHKFTVSTIVFAFTNNQS